MMERLKIPYPVIVEGKYDKLRLEAVMEGQILTTDGFGLFNQAEKRTLFCALAKTILRSTSAADIALGSTFTSSMPPEK